MFIREREIKGRTDMNHHTARRLGDTAEFLNQLARAFDNGVERNGQLTKDDGLVAMQASAALVCENCNRCNLYADSEKEDSYYLYYLLRAPEQGDHIDLEDMPQMSQSGYRKKEDYLVQLNRSPGRAIMDLSWKDRFLESRDAIISQFGELSMMLEGFSRRIDRARDTTNEYEYILKRHFRRYHAALGNLSLLEYENGQREAFLTVRTTNGRCITSKDVALIMGEVMDGTKWSPTEDSRSVIIKQYETARFLEEGGYYMLYGAFRILKKGEKYSGDNYTFCESPGDQVVTGLSDGMGSGEAAARESKQVVGLMEQLLEIGFFPRAALKLVNTVFLLAGPEQHPATLDLSYIDSYTDVLETMKLGAVSTFIIGEEGVEIIEVGGVPTGVLNGMEPVLMSRKLWEGDRIVVVSDGVLDTLPGDDKEQATQQYLESVEEMGPQELADRMLDFVVSFISAPRNDITVPTAGIWKRRSWFKRTGLQGGTFVGIL